MSKRPIRFLYLLTRLGKEPVYDCNNGFVVSAVSEKEARELCSDRSFKTGDEGHDSWQDTLKSNCELIGKSAIEFSQLVLTDFHAG